MKQHATILFALTLLFYSCNLDKQKSKEHFEKAKEYFKSHDWNNASKETDLAIKLDSTNYDGFLLKSKVMCNINFNEEAIQILQFLLSQKYKTDTINYLIAINYFAIGNKLYSQKLDMSTTQMPYENALIFSEYAIKNNSQYFEAYNLKQKVLCNLKRYNEAIITLNNSINIFPNNMKLIYARGIVKNELGDKVGGLDDLNTAINSSKLDSMDLSNAFRFKGDIHFEINSLQDAIIDYSNAINHNPNDKFSYFSRGRVYRDLGEKDNACNDFRKAADLGYVVVYEVIKEYCGE